MTARQRLRRATRESLAIPAFSSPIDCTPWVVGGLWPAELSNPTPEVASLAEYLEADLRRIVEAANDALRVLKRSGMTEQARQEAEARVIDDARAGAARRVESTMRQLHAARATAAPRPPASGPRPRVAPPPRADLERTQILPVANPFAQAADRAPAEQPPREEVGANGRHHAPERTPVAEMPPEQPAVVEDVAAVAPPLEATQVIPVVAERSPEVEVPGPPVAEVPEPPAAEKPPEEDSAADGRRHVPHVPQPATQRGEEAGARQSGLEETQIIPAVTDIQPAAAPTTEAPAASPAEEATDSGRHHVVDFSAAAAPPDADPPSAASPDAARPQAPAPAPAPAGTPAPRVEVEKPPPATAFDAGRLNRLLEFVVRQEPRLSWAVGERADGTVVLVTDLAHGWIPSGITLPDGVRLLEPERRPGKVAALVGDAAHVVTYSPGDSLRRSAGFATTKSSLEPRRLPVIDDLAATLSGATRRFDGLPRIVQRLADAAAAGVTVVDQEVDVLRVHLDTARYQLLIQHPRVDQSLLRKCLLMAATEGIASGDVVSANYHLAWYQKLATPDA